MGLKVVFFVNRERLAGCKDVDLGDDGSSRCIEAVGIAVGANARFMGNDGATTFADFIMVWLLADFVGSGGPLGLASRSHERRIGVFIPSSSCSGFALRNDQDKAGSRQRDKW